MSDNPQIPTNPPEKNVPTKNPFKGPPTKMMKKMFIKKDGGMGEKNPNLIKEGGMGEKNPNVLGNPIKKGLIPNPKKTFKKPPTPMKRKLTDTNNLTRPMPKSPGEINNNEVQNNNNTNPNEEDEDDEIEISVPVIENVNYENKEQTVETKTIENTQVENKSVENKLEENKPVEKPIEITEPIETKTEEITKPIEKTVETKHEETKSVETNQVETKPMEKTEETNPEEIKPEDKKIEETKSIVKPMSRPIVIRSSQIKPIIDNKPTENKTETKSVSTTPENNQPINLVSTTPESRLENNMILKPKMNSLNDNSPRSSLRNSMNDNSSPSSKHLRNSTTDNDISENEDYLDTRDRSNTGTSEDSTDENTLKNIANEVLQSMLINSYIPYNSGNKIIPLYVIEITTSVRKIKSKKSYSQFQKLDQDMKKYDVVKQLPKLPGNGKTFVVTETKTQDIVERCKQLQGYLQAILDNPNFSYREEVRGFLGLEVSNEVSSSSTPKKELNVVPKQRASISMVKSQSVQSFERLVNKTVSLEVQNWLQQIYVSLMHKGSIFERYEKNKPYFACVRLSQDKKSLETGRASKNCDTENIKLTDSIPLSEITEIKKENSMKSSSKSSQSIKTTKNKTPNMNITQGSQNILQLIQTGKKNPLDLHNDDTGVFNIWYFGLCFLLNKPIDERKFQNQQRLMMEIESNLRLMEVDYDVVEKYSKAPPSMPPAPIN
eukprot:TRINITY_DN617_c0_g2_i1.p1 TRINITY_DN617_c0_g2~~TRINITY_DN617_c0_g2_i1.p1  ORF type:complete len:720 (-),score=234.10 TRINITY_DN617_c0_g2_i1:356-2515(-)